MGDRTRSLLSFRGSLLGNLITLVLLIGGGLLPVVLFTGSRAVERLSASMIGRSTSQARARLDGIFQPVETVLSAMAEWARDGLLEFEDLEGFNALLMPVLAHSKHISSVQLADDRGRELMLMQEQGGWRNREVGVGQRRAGLVRAVTWDAQRKLASDEEVELDYDPRERPWYLSASSSPRALEPHWTEPYTFRTSGELGVTASLRWRAPGDGTQVVLAVDVLLADLTRFTSALEVSPRGSLTVLDAQRRVLGLPRDRPLDGEEAWDASLFAPARSLGLPQLTGALLAYGAAGAGDLPCVSFSSGGERWWGGFEHYQRPGTGRLSIVVMVPESDMLGSLSNHRNSMLGILLAGVLAAAAMAFWIERRVNRRIQGALQVARHLGQYTLEEKLGEGGMGAVYLARHALLRRPTAIKLLRGHQAISRVAQARFEREVQITAELTHPNTIVIYDYGHTPEGLFYYAMEYLDGVSLRELVEREGPQPPARVIHLLRQVCGSLQEAHAAKLIHRDIKPANLMLCERGGRYDVLKVLDFGLVKELGDVEQTHSGGLKGTPLYMSPEAIRDEGVDASSDLYSLGATAYMLLTGSHVFEASSLAEVLIAHVGELPVRPSERLGRDLPADLEDIVMACLCKQKAGRPADAASLESALSRCVDADGWSQSEARAWWQAHAQGIRDERAGRRPATDTRLTVDLDERTEHSALSTQH
ncbi:MAG: serine/threonine protein kinase [Planctomycetota bacterium]